MFFCDGPSLPVQKKKGSIWNDYPSGSSAIQVLTVEHDVKWLDVSIVRELDTSNLFYGCNRGRLLASLIVAFFKFERTCSYSKDHTVVENGEEKQTFSSEKNATELTRGRSFRFSAVSKICLKHLKHTVAGWEYLPFHLLFIPDFQASCIACRNVVVNHEWFIDQSCRGPSAEVLCWRSGW